MPIVLAGRRGDQTKSLANDSFQLRRGLELRRASARDVHRLPRAWVLALARLPSTDGKGSKSYQGDGLAALERGADRCKHCAEGSVGGSLGPAALRGHGGDQIRAGHAKTRDVIISSGRMLAEAPERVKAAAIPTVESTSCGRSGRAHDLTARIGPGHEVHSPPRRWRWPSRPRQESERCACTR